MSIQVYKYAGVYPYLFKCMRIHTYTYTRIQVSEYTSIRVYNIREYKYEVLVGCDDWEWEGRCQSAL